MDRYPSLFTATVLLRLSAALIILFGIGASLYFMISTGEISLIERVVAIGGIVFSLAIGILLYATADFYRCIIDIEANTRAKS